MTHKLYKITFIVLSEYFPDDDAQDRRAVPAQTCIDKHTHFISRTPPAPRASASDPTIQWVSKQYTQNTSKFKHTLGKITVTKPDPDDDPNTIQLENIQPWTDTNARVLWKTRAGYVMTIDK